MDRRDFLKVAACAGSLAVTGCAGTSPRGTRAKVVVIGGGFGGATAAKYLKLMDPGIDVTLVEKNPHYLTCPFSNNVIAGIDTIQSLKWDYKTLAHQYGIRLIIDTATAIDAENRKLRLQNGLTLNWDRLVVSPGIDFRWNAIDGYDETASTLIPHAWKAGKQTVLLRQQLEAMPNGGVVVIAPPANPFRCPPGPYERASLIAHFLRQHKPKSKIIIVDAKTKFSKQALFMKGWRDLYPGMIEWISWADEGDIERIGVKSRTIHTEFSSLKADVLNLIPPQKAGAIAVQAGLTDSSGWCPVEQRSFESSLVPNIHVIGDASIAAPMPKSGFSANAQAKICAAGVAALLDGREPPSTSLINTCYSFLKPDYAISVSAVYRYSMKDKKLITQSSGVTPMAGDRQLESRYAHGWYQNITADAFS